MIEARDIRKAFAGRTILDGVSATFRRGEVVSLIGPSGGGKSTLLRCLNGLERPDAGDVRLGEHVLGAPSGAASATARAGASGGGGSTGHGGDEAALAAIRRRVGFVFQGWHLFGHRSVLENVIEAPIHVLGRARDEAVARARALLDRVGLGHRVDARPHELSGGEQQRAAIARALAMEPELLLLDEPTSALDPERVGDLVSLLEGLVASAGLGLVAVTHEMRFARALSTRVVVLHGGRIVEEGAPADVIDRPQAEPTRRFLGLSR